MFRLLILLFIRFGIIILWWWRGVGGSWYFYVIVSWIVVSVGYKGLWGRKFCGIDS